MEKVRVAEVLRESGKKIADNEVRREKADGRDNVESVDDPVRLVHRRHRRRRGRRRNSSKGDSIYDVRTEGGGVPQIGRQKLHIWWTEGVKFCGRHIWKPP